MNDVNIGKDNSWRPSAFTGRGGEYFLICLVNSSLTIVTLGIYGPWVPVKCRHYTYRHVALKGQPFSHKGTSGAILVSMLLVIVACPSNTSCLTGQHFALGLFPLAFLICGIPCMAVKSLQYQANMISLNDIRSGFNCLMVCAWWVMLGLPVLLASVFWFTLYLIVQVTTSIGGLLFNLVALNLFSATGLGVVHGTTYSKWIPLLGNSVTFSIHKFSIRVNVKERIRGCMLVILTMVPFITVVGIMTAPVFQQLTTMTMLGRSGASSEFVL